MPINGSRSTSLTAIASPTAFSPLEKPPAAVMVRGILTFAFFGTDAYVSLEERTAMANRYNADLFLSIHANASPVPAARGIETYFLNFAANPEAEAIALNNKLDESRDFATIVQSTLYDQLRRTNKTLKNLGVKQAPFMVLVGATMPSVLAEISFMSNGAEATLLKTDRYKQQIAEALKAGITRYRGSLKKMGPRTE